MKILKWLLVSIAVLALLLIGIGFMLPAKVSVSRSVTVDVPAGIAFAALNGFRQFNHWSPWAELADDIDYQLSGPLQGEGARMQWHSDDPSVGTGSQEIIASTPYERIEVALRFDAFGSLSTFELEAESDTVTQLEWGFEADFGRDLVGRYMGLLMDGFIGDDYERGLARFKSWIEGFETRDLPEQRIQFVQANAMPVAMLSGEASGDDSARVLGQQYGELLAFMAENDLEQSGAPLAITRAFDAETGRWRFDAAIPLDRSCESATRDARIRCATTYAGPALKLSHVGSYEDAQRSYAALADYTAAAGLERNGDAWEHYVTDPGAASESQLTMDIYWPVK